MSDLITRKEAAEMLTISPRSLDRWVTQRVLRHVKFPGGGVRFYRSDINRLIEKSTVKAATEAA